MRPIVEPPVQLKPIQRAFQLGFRYGYRRAEMRMRREADAAVDRLEATNAQVKNEVCALRGELQRPRAIETGVNAERDPVEHPWLR